MSNWRQARLGEFLKIKHGYAFIGKYITDIFNKNILVTPGNFHLGGGFKTTKFKYFNGDYPSEYVLKDGDIVVTMTDLSKESDTLGYSAMIPTSRNGEKYLHNQRIGLVQFTSNEVNQDYIYWLLRTFEYHWYVVSSASGTSIMHTSPSRICNYEFSLPPLLEQQAIAEVLSSLDDKIDLLHRQNQTLEQMAETLFRQWFIEEAKEEWEERPLSDYFVFMGGYAFKSSSYSDQGLYKVITIKSVQDGFLDVKAATFINDLPINLKDYQKLKIGDILMSLTGNVGRVCIVDREKCLLNQRVAKIEPIESKNMPYAYFYFRQPNMIQKLTYLAKGTAQLNLSPVETLNQKDILPPTERIEEYSTICRPFYEKIIHNKVQIITLEQQRDTLLPKLMSGEVRLKLDKE